MGGCISQQQARQRQNCSSSKYQMEKSQKNNYNSTQKYDHNQKEQHILKLIYHDLSSRISQKTLNLQNFLLFFHKNGFWGARLFQQFVFNQEKLINQEDFIDGIIKLIKKNQTQKIELLFKFFSSSSTSTQIVDSNKFSAKRTDSLLNKLKKCQQNKKNDEQQMQKGVKFSEFLIMLYNYPKQDLKQILNDKDFFQNQIKDSLITISQNRRLQSIYKIGLPSDKNKTILCRVSEKSQLDHSRQKQLPTQEDVQPSMVGKDILRQIKSRQTDETTLTLQDGDQMVEVRTNNIHNLVKKFAKNMFKSLNLNCQTGELNLQQFTQWIQQHKTLYNNYYEGFHNDIWQISPQNQKPKYTLIKVQKESFAKFLIQERCIKVFILLRHSIIVVCQEFINDNPLDIICLDGLQVHKIFQERHGYGFQISHRDIYYEPKKLFLKNQVIRDDWYEYLKFYKGGTIQNIYRIGKKIGTGKFSIVYQAYSKQTNSPVAIKVIQYKNLDLQARQLIAHQSSIMQVLCHPLLVQFKDSIQTKTHMYIITQLCPGKDLFQFVKESQYLDQIQSACIAQQIIVGVRYMHSLGIIHRDLKPENIMISYNQEEKKIQTVKIIDFGFANYLSIFLDMNPEDVLAGTPNYIAPQLLRCEQIGYKSDNFAIGSILYFMISGTLPFNSFNIQDIFSKTLQGNYNFKGKIWQKASQNVKDLITCFLKSDPKQRITLEQALKHPWFKQIKQIKSMKSLSSKQIPRQI